MQVSTWNFQSDTPYTAFSCSTPRFSDPPAETQNSLSDLYVNRVAL